MKRKLFLAVFVMILTCFFLNMGHVNAKSYVEGGSSIYMDCGIRTSKKESGQVYQVINNIKTYRVTDKGRLASGQPSYLFDIRDYGLSDQQLYHHGYSCIVIIFQVTMKEIDDGYQEIHLYNPSATGKPDIASLTAFEHGRNVCNKEYARYEFYTEISGDALSSCQFGITFSAHGAFSDDWVVGNVKVQLCLSSEKPKYNDIVFVKNATVDNIWA